MSFRKKAVPLLVKRDITELKNIFDIKGNFFHPQQILMDDDVLCRADRVVCRETKMEFPD
jgi:hypothetical protein